MSDSRIKIGVLKLGCIGAVPLADIMLDERAERKDIEVRSFSSGSSLTPESCEVALECLLSYAPDLAIVVSPNAALPGPTRIRERLHEAGVPTLSISDGPAEKAFYKKNDEGKKVPSVLQGQGFIVLPMDPMIGARREFLDPSEMVLFNGELLHVFSITGVIRFLETKIDGLIEGLKSGTAVEMPKIKATPEMIITAGAFGNPYAEAKAYAAIKILEALAKVTTKACFKVRDRERYITMVTAGHEMLRAAVRLADEARELEKAHDSLMRTPHGPDGTTLRKRGLKDPFDSTS